MLYLTCSLGQLIGPSTSSGGIAQTKLDVSSRNPPRCRNDSSTAKRPARLMTHIMFGTLVNYHISSPSKRTLRTVPRRDKARGAAAKVGRLPAGSLLFLASETPQPPKQTWQMTFHRAFFFWGSAASMASRWPPLAKPFMPSKGKKRRAVAAAKQGEAQVRRMIPAPVVVVKSFSTIPPPRVAYLRACLLASCQDES